MARKGLRCQSCRELMKQTTRKGQTEYFVCRKCGRRASKDGKGVRWQPK